MRGHWGMREFPRYQAASSMNRSVLEPYSVAFAALARLVNPLNPWISDTYAAAMGIPGHCSHRCAV